MTYLEKVQAAAAYIRENLGTGADTLVVLGSGLGKYCERLGDKESLAYRDIPHFPVSTAQSHKGNLVLGKSNGKPVYVMQGRFHLYEGYDPADVVLPIRALHQLGVKRILLTNAAGGINPAYRVGDFMLIDDHLKFIFPSPVAGMDALSFGDRFVNMTGAYDREWLAYAEKALKAENIPAHRGVYALMPGPQFETPAEIRALRMLGGDAVGMSTVPECIAARQLDMKVIGISCISNAAAAEDVNVSGDEVVETTNRVMDRFCRAIDLMLQF